LAIRPKHPESLANLGFVLYGRGKTQEAEQTLLRAIDLDPKNATAYFFLGKLYLMEDRPNEAHEKLQVAVELNPRLAAARKGLERAEEERRKPPSPGCGCARRSSDSTGRAAALPAVLLLGPHIARLSRKRKRKRGNPL
jgi:tetratricopeptide (TPR) repeat protein